MAEASGCVVLSYLMHATTHPSNSIRYILVGNDKPLEVIKDFRLAAISADVARNVTWALSRGKWNCCFMILQTEC